MSRARWMAPGRALGLGAAVAVAVVSLVAGNGASAAETASSAGAVSLARCGVPNIPTGFSVDAAHSGTMTPAQYSASGDIQASLIYDHFQHGRRAVYTDLAVPNTSPGGNQVIECVAMDFSTSQNANRFLQSFEYLRSQAGSIVTKVRLPGRLAGTAVGYREGQQAFSGYHIASTTVMEEAVQHGDHFYDVSVAGPNPTVRSAFGLLRALGGQS